MAQLINISRDKWQVIIDYKGVRKKRTLIGSKQQAQQWGLDREKEIEAQGFIAPEMKATTVGELVVDYEKDMAAHNVHFSHTKSYNLFKITQAPIGKTKLSMLNKHDVIAFGKELAKTRGPNGVKERLNYLNKALKWGKATRDYPLQAQIEAVTNGIAVLVGYRLVGDAVARNRVLTDAEIDKVRAQADLRRASNIDMAAIVDVLRVLPLRLGELCKVEWTNLDPVARTATFKRKHPTNPDFVEVVPFPVIGGVDTYKLIADRPRHLARPFPYSPKTISTTFWLLARMAGVEDFHLHDLRAHAITFLQHYGLPKEHAKKMMGHSSKSETLDRVYTRISPQMVHETIERTGIDKAKRRKTAQVVPLQAVS